MRASRAGVGGMGLWRESGGCGHGGWPCGWALSCPSTPPPCPTEAQEAPMSARGARSSPEASAPGSTVPTPSLGRLCSWGLPCPGCLPRNALPPGTQPGPPPLRGAAGQLGLPVWACSAA